MILNNQLYCGDCLELMKDIPDQHIDLILTDLPYGITNSKKNTWDKIIDPKLIWFQFRRIIKPNGSIILTGLGLFSATMIYEAQDIYKYSLVWKKNKPRGFLNAKIRPMSLHEDILVFSKGKQVYNPQKTKGHKPVNSYTKNTSDGSNYGDTQKGFSGGGSTERYPVSVIEIPVVNNDSKEKIHPTQKPVELGEYLIKTYSNPNDLVLDCAFGSGSFLIAAKKTNRYYIGIEIDKDMVNVAQERLNLV
jgi:site-specific DNA-methyltransferase (adenine-specific)